MAADGEHHFVLVHGSGHGAWCWYKVVTALEKSGHKVTAVDLAASGIDPKQVEEIATVFDYIEPLMTFMKNLADGQKVILVSHSSGGLAASMAMEKFPTKVSAGVFVSAAMVGPGGSIPQYEPPEKLDNKFKYGNGSDKPPTALLFGPQYLKTYLYQNSPEEDLTLATLLTRYTPLFPDPNASKGFVLTKQNYGSVYRVFIMSLHDKLFTVDEQEQMIKANPPDEVMEIWGSDHMVMFSRPHQLSLHLNAIASKFKSIRVRL